MNGTGARDVLRRAVLAAPLAASLALSLAASAPARAASTWVADPARSRLTFVATQSGGEFQGRFNRFRADIAFDPGDLAGSRFHVTIETASADTQDETRDQALVGDDFFAAGRWPTAAYDASRFVATTGGRYQAQGRLTIRGISRDVAVVFSFRPAAGGRSAALTGGTTIRRLDFGVGQGEWQDTKWVGNDVRIEFELVLEPGAGRAGATRGQAAPTASQPTAVVLKPGAA